MWPFKKQESNLDKIRNVKTVKIQGIIFKIKKINPLDHLTGAKLMLAIYDKYQLQKPNDNAEMRPEDVKKIKEHYVDVFLASVIKPELSRKESDNTKIWVGEILQNYELAVELYTAIHLYTYGKKKLPQLN